MHKPYEPRHVNGRYYRLVTSPFEKHRNFRTHRLDLHANVVDAHPTAAVQINRRETIGDVGGSLVKPQHRCARRPETRLEVIQARRMLGIWLDANGAHATVGRHRSNVRRWEAPPTSCSRKPAPSPRQPRARLRSARSASRSAPPEPSCGGPFPRTCAARTTYGSARQCCSFISPTSASLRDASGVDGEEEVGEVASLDGLTVAIR
mmetsp:Transcript_10482/g.25624  ORF Transcript_10482/g.25624 Transcript_10482/m.25624 type:complete len:206 (-) Transcript_10482:318-935(-)